MPGRWYSIKEAADALGVSHDTVSRLVERGELPAIRVSERIVRIPTPAFEAYVSGRRPAPRRVVWRAASDDPDIGAEEGAGRLESV